MTDTYSTALSPSLSTSSSADLEERLARVAERDCEVRAWAFLDPELARSQAAAADSTEARSPLHGVTVGLKDIIETADQPTAYGSPIWTGHTPHADAVAVSRLRDAGAVIMGKTTTTEFATYQPTVTMNPHDAGHTPGGSSSGSAAAVADGQVRVALGTQTAGSVNRPGSFCGVFTLKPTFNRWPFTGVLPVSLTFDTLGGFARDPRDLARLDHVLANPRWDGTASRSRGLPELSSLRVGVLRGPWWDRAEPEAVEMLDAVARLLETVVGQVSEVDVPAAIGDLQESHANIQSVEAGFYLRDMIAPDPSKVSALLAHHLAEAAALSADQVESYRATLRDVRSFGAETMRTHDVLITLAAPGEAPATRETTGDPAFNRFASTTGFPAVGLPVGTGAHGLPLGLQIIAPENADQALVELACRLTFDVGLSAIPPLPGTSS
jgi:Asp-tRNA(Asn)/Glu-tRNA(Gln) amidotransferase A subunit family amidase